MTLEHTRSYIMEQLIHQENVSDDMTEKWKTTQNSSTNLSLSSRDLLFTNVASGLTAGMVAAFLTTPVDTIYVNKISASSVVSSKLARQNSLTATALGRDIIRKHGFLGLFRGVVPRVFKVAPSCAIVIASYEMFKRLIWTSTAAAPTTTTHHPTEQHEGHETTNPILELCKEENGCDGREKCSSCCC